MYIEFQKLILKRILVLYSIYIGKNICKMDAKNKFIAIKNSGSAIKSNKFPKYTNNLFKHMVFSIFIHLESQIQ